MDAWLVLVAVALAAGLAYFVVRRLFGAQLSILEWLSNPLGR